MRGKCDEIGVSEIFTGDVNMTEESVARKNGIVIMLDLYGEEEEPIRYDRPSRKVLAKRKKKSVNKMRKCSRIKNRK
jgi:hypothetical protein